MPPEPTLEEKVAFLRDPASYADETSVVQSIETHFAWVFLTARRAYKLKKPMRHEQLDYASLAAREQGCREEVRLNRRLAPSVYQGVLPLSIRCGRLALGAGESVCDWLVQMVRLPAAGMLDHALRLGTAGEADLTRIALTLARFFDQARTNEIDGPGYLRKLTTGVRTNHEALRNYGTRLPLRLIGRVEGLQLDFIGCARPELAARGACVVEGHGDLRAEHVYLGPPVAVIDCLEFDRELRLLDPAEEIALLALEIEQLGRRDLATLLIDRFRALSALPAEPYVYEFYISRRAATRAKLAAWHLDDPQFPDPRPWIARSETLLTAAAEHAERALRQLESPRVASAGAEE